MQRKAECIGEIPKDSGSKCCVLDNNTNKFAVIPVMPVSEVRSMLTQMGYSEISAKEIADKVGLSRVTVRRYMNFLLEKGEISGNMNYETGGRPCMLYKVNK